MSVEKLSGWSQSDLLPRSVEQFDSELFLQLAHRRGQRGLNNVGALHGSREAHLASNGHEMLQLSKFHPPPSSVL
ncbi:hypothetical protein MBOL_31440 [Mycobacteroides abscessus subsp. bolletii BD]|nr:hypothetical protein MBOL_31440 [Mycobacteroides abscessus subsp. bolletii BD]